jgi:hypothetical protein
MACSYVIATSMILAGLFAGLLFIGLIVGDWLYFIRLTPDAIRYGCRVASNPDQWPGAELTTLGDRFTPEGVLMLPHGVAWFYPQLSQIAIRPQYRLFSRRFRTAWPVKGLIHLSPQDQLLNTLCVKRMPWSSAIMTLWMEDSLHWGEPSRASRSLPSPPLCWPLDSSRWPLRIGLKTAAS